MQSDLGEGLSPVERQFVLQIDLESKLFGQQDETDSTQVGNHNALIHHYLDTILARDPIKIKDDFKDFQWLNVSRPLSLSNDLEGLVVLLDFFTYCCINCLHILPFLSEVERKYDEKELIVLGVHSPKFDNEKSVENVTSAILRNDICHPVCNDSGLMLWTQLSINCWPTIAIIGPAGELLFTLMGETAIHSRLQLYVDVCLNYFAKLNRLNVSKKTSLPVDLLKHKRETNLLNYPSKIAISPGQNRIAIANTLKHSVIVSTADGMVECIVGSNVESIKGLKDGSFEEALFHCPQGVAWTAEDTLYVCDTENHAIRRIDLVTRLVSTVAGNGEMSEDRVGGQCGTDQGLNSPWDLVYHQPSDRLFIAMAGSHQVWTLILSQGGDTVHGGHYPLGTCLCLAGDGNEQKRNHRSPLKASFAQPSGIVFHSSTLYIADSESSSIRAIDLTTLAVSTVAGGNANPLDLFAYGDVDGVGSKCRLQHPMGVTSNHTDHLYVADTFNHKIKKLTLETKLCETLPITWSSCEQVTKLFEPNGLCYFCPSETDVPRLLVADTNNHRIVSINLKNMEATTWNLFRLERDISLLQISPDLPKSNITKQSELIEIIHSGDQLSLSLKFNLPDGFKLEPSAKHSLRVYTTNDLSCLSIEPKKLVTSDLNDLSVVIKGLIIDSDFDTVLAIECDVTLCHTAQNYCKFSKILVEQPLRCSILPNQSNVMKSKSIIINL